MTTLLLDFRAFHRLVRLADEVGEIPVERTEAALEHTLRELARLTGADDAFSVVARREPGTGRDRLPEWRPHHVHHLDTGQAGRDRAARPVDLMPRRAGEEDWDVREHLAPLGVRDQIRARSVIDARTALLLCLRRTGRAPFRARDRHLLLVAAGMLRRPLRNLVLARGWLHSGRGLSRRERQVLGLLLEGLREAEVAERLGISARTAHHHVTAVYRRLGVRGRRGLLALWADRAERRVLS